MSKINSALEEDQVSTLQDDNVVIENVEPEDLTSVIDGDEELSEVTDAIDVAEDALVDLDKYREIVSDEAVTDGTLDVVTIAVESLRKTVGFKNYKLATENYSSKRLALEEEIKGTFNRIWTAILNAFKKAYEWLKKFFSELFNKNVKMKNGLESLLKEFKTIDVSKLKDSDKTFEISYPAVSTERKDIANTIEQLVVLIESLADFKEEGEHWIRTRMGHSKQPPSISIFNYVISAKADENDIVKFTIESKDFEWKKETIEVKKLGDLSGIIGNLEDAIKAIDDFISFTKTRNDSIKEIEQQIKDIEKLKFTGNFKKEYEDINSTVLKITKAKLNFYTHFLPKLDKEIYSLFNNYFHVVNSFYKHIK